MELGWQILFFLPVASKLKSHVARQVHFDEMLVEGLVAMASGESPNMLLLKLNNFGQQKQNEIKTQEK